MANVFTKTATSPARQAYYYYCNHILSRGERQGERCNAETENGRHACAKCLKDEFPIKNPNARDAIKTYL